MHNNLLLILDTPTVDLIEDNELGDGVVTNPSVMLQCEFLGVLTHLDMM